MRLPVLDRHAAYARYCRPRNARLLHALRLDVVYERASGDQLVMRDDRGRATAVTDFVGGYGATFLGHNHPALVAVATASLSNEAPFAAQASIRARAAELAARLNEMLFERFGVEHAVVFASTGAEAVEAAIKHAELSYQTRHGALREEVRRRLARIVRGLRVGRYTLSRSARATLDLGNDDPSAFAARVLVELDEAFRDVEPCAIALARGFHGKTTGALSFTHGESYRAPFSRLLLDADFVPMNDVDALRVAVEARRVRYLHPVIGNDGVVELESRSASSIVAMFVEPIQGEGGVHPCSAAFAREARALADRDGFLLVFDEIQSGFGRTGTFLYAEQLGVRPDAFLVSKSLGGGLAKISAFLLERSLFDERFGLVHSSTFAEDDHSAAIALAALDVLEGKSDPVGRARRSGEHLRAHLAGLMRAYPSVISAVRGAGLMIGVELADASSHAPGTIKALAEQGLLGYAVCAHLLHEHRLRVMPCMSSPRVLRLEPSAFVADVELAKLVTAFEGVCRILAAGDAYTLLRCLVGLEGTTVGITRERTAPVLRPIGAVRRARVGFVGYFVDAEQMARWDPSLARFSIEEREALVARACDAIEPTRLGAGIIRSPLGEVELCSYGLFVDSKIFYEGLRGERRRMLEAQVVHAVEMAKEDGCTVVGLGGLTSVVTGNGRLVDVEGVAITTGNSLTVAMCVEAAEREASALGIDLRNATAGAVGATGNIGSVYCLRISDEVARLVLVSRPGREASLVPLMHLIYEHAYARLARASGDDGAIEDPAPLERGLSRTLHRFVEVRRMLEERVPAAGLGPALARIGRRAEQDPIVVTSDRSALRSASVILGASNTAEPLIYPVHVGDGPVLVIDVAVPGDASRELASLAPRVKVISGGAVDLGPHNRELATLSPLPRGVLYACTTETAVLGLEGWDRHFSYGSIELEQVQLIHALAKKHGFTLAKGDYAGALAGLA